MICTHYLSIYIQPKLQYVLYSYMPYFYYTDGVHGTKSYIINIPKPYIRSMCMESYLIRANIVYVCYQLLRRTFMVYPTPVLLVTHIPQAYASD